MTLIGKTLGHYKIGDQPLGRGGMGEVYRARDLKLGREVAIKVLPEEFARDPDRVARFQREAKLLASLNHPNIAAIYGLEESGGIQFLVLELVEGETLADQLKRGSIPVEESLKLALQIAEALEAAHEKGIIHRDLKPANTKITPEGKVKVLDFGLAKAFAGEQKEATLTYSPTLSELATQQGVILGTAAYMSPEQAKGKLVDTRADVWAFGVVLYEMLTGRQLFAAETVLDTLAAALTKEPDWEKVPARLRPLLRRCLQKDPHKRLRDIGDVKIELEEVLAMPNDVGILPVTTMEHRTKLRMMLPWIAAAVILTAIIAGVAVWKLKPSEPLQVSRFSYEPPEGQRVNNLYERALAVSPDGRKLVYSASEGLYLRSMDEMDARIIPSTKGAWKPFFSPDGEWVGYLSRADNQLKKIAIAGGAPVKLADVSSIGSFSWGIDGTIVYGQQKKGIMRVSSNGGVPETIVKAENETLLHPQILPDGKSVLFNTMSFKVNVQSLKSGERKELFDGHTAHYLPTGHIIYAVENNLFAVPFNPDRLEAAGGQISVVEGVLRFGGGAPQYAVSDSGTLVYILGTAPGDESESTLVWVDRNGKEEPVAVPTNVYDSLRISPDGRRVALTVGSGANKDIWIWDLDRKMLTRLTLDKGENDYPIWTLDGKRIVFYSHRKDDGGVYWKAADGTGEDEHVGSVPGQRIQPSSWSNDGKTLVVRAGFEAGSLDIGALSMEGDHKYRLLLHETYDEAQPQISPDGQWMAYTSSESGQAQVYVRPFPEVDKGGRLQVSASGGHSPLWSPDGREMFYRSGDAVIAVSVKSAPTFTLGAPPTLFRRTYVGRRGASWDISLDGKRFLMMKEAASTSKPAAEAPRKINIVLNWFEELKQKVPLK